MTALATLNQRVLDHQFSETRYSAFIDEMLNEAQRKVARKVSMRTFFDVETLATVAGTPTVALPSDYSRLYTLEYPTEDRHLTNVDIPQMDGLPNDSSGLPTTYTIDRPNVRLWPTPDAVYSLQLRYYRKPLTMTASQGTEIDEDYDGVLVSYALARCFRRENDLEAAQFHMGEFDRELAEMQADLQDDSQDAGQPEQVGGMWEPDRGITVVRP